MEYFLRKVLYGLSVYIRCMKWGELRHEGYVSVLTTSVVMTPKQQQGILVRGDRASGQGIICKTCEEMHIGTQESYMRKGEPLYTSLVLKCGVW